RGQRDYGRVWHDPGGVRTREHRRGSICHRIPPCWGSPTNLVCAAPGSLHGRGGPRHAAAEGCFTRVQRRCGTFQDDHDAPPQSVLGLAVRGRRANPIAERAPNTGAVQTSTLRGSSHPLPTVSYARAANNSSASQWVGNASSLPASPKVRASGTDGDSPLSFRGETAKPEKTAMWELGHRTFLLPEA